MTTVPAFEDITKKELGNLRKSICALVSIFFALSLVVPKVAGAVYLFLFLLGCGLAFHGQGELIDNGSRKVALVFLAYFLDSLIMVLASDVSSLGYDILSRDIRFAGGVFIALSLVGIRYCESLVVRSVFAGGVLAGLVSLFQISVAGNVGDRASGSSIPIVFGHLLVPYAIIYAASLLNEKKLTIRYFLPLIGFTFTLVAIILSGTRGAFLALFCGIIFLVVKMKGWRSSMVYGLGLGGLVLATTMVAYQLSDNVRYRVEKTITQIDAERWSFDHGLNPLSEGMGCIGGRGALESILSNSILRGSREAKAIIRQSSKEIAIRVDGSSFDCQFDYVIELKNFSKVEDAWLILPYRSVPPGREDIGGVVVKGQGDVRIVGVDEGAQPFDASTWTLVRPKSGAGNREDLRFLIFLEPGETNYLVPFAIYPSEYSFGPIAQYPDQIRMITWRAAVRAFLNNPVVGIGVGGFKAYLENEAGEGNVPWTLTRYDHAHNEILNTLAERGLIGLTLLALIYLAPFWLFLRHGGWLGCAGASVVVCYVVSGATEVMFNHSIVISSYVLLVLALMRLCANKSRGPAETVDRS